MTVVKGVEFVGGFPTHDILPEFDGAEIALMGRSNSGKSTLVNRVTLRKRIAVSGRTPGTTQSINLYETRFVDNQGSDKVCRLVDWPGFGYGRFSKKKRTILAKDIVTFICEREPLKLLCLLNDCSRDPEKDELAIRDLCAANQIPLMIVITKVDKLNQREKIQRLRALCDGYNLEEGDFFLTGRDAPAEMFWKRISVFM